MTIYIAHRQNKIKNIIKSKNSLFEGIEIDLRSDSKKIVVNHDPFKNGADFIKNIKYFKKYFLLIDIKSSGISEKICKILKKKKIKFLLLNLIQQEFIQMVKLGYSKHIFLRFSSFENFDLKKKKFNMIKWIWFDFFDNYFITVKEYKYIKKFKKRICITSPDLLGINTKFIIKLIRHLNKNKMKIDMVCSKKENIKIWKKYYKY